MAEDDLFESKEGTDPRLALVVLGTMIFLVLRRLKKRTGVLDVAGR